MMDPNLTTPVQVFTYSGSLNGCGTNVGPVSSTPFMTGSLAGGDLALTCIEYLTPARLADASAGLGLAWRRHRVWYPLWYELRPLKARVSGGRRPSRFDLWEATVA